MRRLRRLLSGKAFRARERAFVVEGVEVFRTALDAGASPEAVYVAAERGVALGDDVVALLDRVAAAGVRVFELEPGVVERVASTVTPQPVLAVFPMLHVVSPPPESRLVVVLAGVRDPGNAGTALRSADAVGVDAVAFCGESVDPYNPKTVRASAGSLFHVPLVVGDDPGALLGSCRQAGMRCIGAVPRGGVSHLDIDWSDRIALVLGNEASGIPSTLGLDGLVSIDMVGRAESLNVGVACAVLCFEALRQRRSTMPR